nr:protein kinase-like domain, phloem protein 2-like protein [Tanacetum cinerariifolium]
NVPHAGYNPRSVVVDLMALHAGYNPGSATITANSTSNEDFSGPNSRKVIYMTGQHATDQRIRLDLREKVKRETKTITNLDAEQEPVLHEIEYQLLNNYSEQEDFEKWEPKLPKDYKEIIQMSKCPEIYSTIKKEDLYSIFSKGILLQQDKVVLSFHGDGERNEMVSAGYSVCLSSIVTIE